MQSLLRTQPENLDDLTVQVALVRPGPIQGKAVHPYIDRRQKLRKDPDFVAHADHPLLDEPLRSTFGVVVFQDQVLEVAMALAGFTVGEAEGLRRAMSRKRSHAALEAYRARFIEGATHKGVPDAKADEIYDKLVGFSGFGFPKSHAAAFGLLAYQSSWLRHHYPAEFLAALLNAQPMGFYPPASLVRDAQRRGVEVRPPDVNVSAAKCVLEGEAVRIGLEYVQSVGEDDARAIVEERERGGPYRGIVDLVQRAPAGRDELEALVASGACDSFGEPRRKLLWRLGLVPRSESVPGTAGEEQQLALPLGPTAAIPNLPDQTAWERMLADYGKTSLSVGVHPLELLRSPLARGDAVQPRAGRRMLGWRGRRRRDGDRAPAAGDCERRRLHASRRRARPDEPDHPAAGVRELPADRPRRAAPARAREVRAPRPQPERPRPRAGDAEPSARRVAEMDVNEALPRAHHFGHR